METMPGTDFSLTESRLRVVLSFTAAPMLVALSALLFAAGIAAWIPSLIGMIGVLLTAFVLLDFATKVEFGPEEIRRKAPLRTARHPWSDVEKLVAPKRGGLALVETDGRHVVLVDRKLATHELEAARSRARDAGVGLEVLTRRTRFGA